MTTPKNNMAQEKRFEFGANWARFLSVLNEGRIQMAEESLKRMLDVNSLAAKSFLDIGSGSGLFSLAARRLGAKVHSFDYDPQSVACTMELKGQYFRDDADWTVEEGSALDTDYLKRLGQFDVVYSWGVLHHTGAMKLALENVASMVREGGALFIAIYNDQGWISQYWTLVKRSYNRNRLYRFVLILLHSPYLWFGRYFVRALTGRLSLDRGMSLRHDMLDWLGGYPFEYAKPEEIFDFFRSRGFRLDRLKTCRNRHGCNEFVFTNAGKGELKAGAAAQYA